MDDQRCTLQTETCNTRAFNIIAFHEDLRHRTNGFFTRREPNYMRRIRGVWAASQYREYTSQALSSGLRDAENIEIVFPWGAEVRCTVDIQLEVKSPAYTRVVIQSIGVICS